MYGKRVIIPILLQILLFFNKKIFCQIFHHHSTNGPASRFGRSVELLTCPITPGIPRTHGPTWNTVVQMQKSSFAMLDAFLISSQIQILSFRVILDKIISFRPFIVLRPSSPTFRVRPKLCSQIKETIYLRRCFYGEVLLPHTRRGSLILGELPIRKLQESRHILHIVCSVQTSFETAALLGGGPGRFFIPISHYTFKIKKNF